VEELHIGNAVCEMDDVVTDGDKPATRRGMENVAKSTSVSLGGAGERTLKPVAR
jgi:hypothetical protein